jgi:threonyl-tRNA synthetase
VGDDLMRDNFNNPLVVFVAIEEMDNENTIKEAGSDIRKIAIQNEVGLVLLNPFAHLTSRLAKPAQAISLLDKLAENLRECVEFETERLTFGWYKEFSLNVKGEDNSQIYREY